MAPIGMAPIGRMAPIGMAPIVDNLCRMAPIVIKSPNMEKIIKKLQRKEAATKH